MKNLFIVVLIVVCFVFATAQTTPSLGITSSGTAAGCLSPTGVAVALCAVPGDGLYVAVGSGAFQKVVAGQVQPSGVTDYSQLTGKPTTISCSTSSQSNSGLTASGCTIK